MLNYKLDDLLVGIVTQIRLKRQATPRVVMATVSGCYGHVVDRLFGKRLLGRHRSCENLLSP